MTAAPSSLASARRPLLGRLASVPGTLALVRALNVGLWPRLDEDMRRRLAGRRVEIAVTDWGVSCYFTVKARGFVPRPRFPAPDLRIAASAHDFGALGAGEEDADTLYFGRRLVVEGDTELALAVKNTLDALDAAPARKWVRRAHRLACRLRGRIRRDPLT